MGKKTTTTKQIKRKLLDKYRLVILSQNTFEEHLSLKLTRLNVFVISMLIILIIMTGTFFLIANTAFKELIPGYASSTFKKEAINLSYRTDSLQQVIEANEKYFESIQKVLRGDISTANFNKDSIVEAIKLDANEVNLSTIAEDSILREKVNKEDKYNLFNTAKVETSFALFPPASGTISEGYNTKAKHYAIDIVVPKNTPIKAVADGTVIFASWTSDTGYVILIEHSYGLISVYKHNASLTKVQGDLVKAGEVIANSGNSGELSTGPHLHFELWNDGYPVNPTNYIDFN